jgi:hypothetical protein
MIVSAAKALVSALEAVVSLTGSAQDLEDPLIAISDGMIGAIAIAVLIMDMTMAATLARTITTTSAATLKVMVRRSSRGDAGGGTTRATVGQLDKDS